MNSVKLSGDYKSNTQKAILSIVLFVIVYLALVGLALCLTALCIYGGIFIIVLRPMFITLALGAGLASVGILVLIFLVKFIFKSHKSDRSHLIEVTRAQEPELFALIDDIVTKVDTTRPKKVYLSTDVNASVFYDSSFWSMFLPIRKNLQIGIGLVNTLTKDELKGVLAHEFGHFSQRTMKVGSYVYNVNQIIFNMLNDNGSYDDILQSWANVSSYFYPFVLGALKIVQGIQWVLGKMYNIINLSYMALSRQMEFHADEVAASVTGSEPLKNALLRLDLAQHSYQTVLNYYGAKVSDNIQSSNIYPEQAFVMNFVAQKSGIPIHDGFPIVSKSELTRFNKSKLVIGNQWASHPSTEERVDRLSSLNISSQLSSNEPGWRVFKDEASIQRLLTNHLFKGVVYKNEPALSPLDVFVTDFETSFRENSFDSRYNGYYDDHDPIAFEVSWIASDSTPSSHSFDSLFGSSQTELVYILLGIKGDIETLKHISSNETGLKSFDYDGKKYKISECAALLEKLSTDQSAIEEKLRDHDIQIFRFFNEIDRTKENGQLVNLYTSLFDFNKKYQDHFEVHEKILAATQFMQWNTPFDQIRQKLVEVYAIEKDLKAKLREMLADPVFSPELTDEIRKNLNAYLDRDMSYFDAQSYNQHNLEVFWIAIGNFRLLLNKLFFSTKKSLLDYQISLINKG